nr:IS5 family transposase [Derxia gummosa]
MNDSVIEPHYPKTNPRGGRPTLPLEAMLRVYFMQQWFALSDLAMEDELHESESIRRFAGLSLIDDAISSNTAILRFRHLLEKHKLTEAIGTEVQQLLKSRGLILRTATIINAPSSTKNADGQRDPDMTQTKNGQQWYFGMKAHIGVDAERAWCIPSSPAPPASTTNAISTICCTARRQSSGRIAATTIPISLALRRAPAIPRHCPSQDAW